MPNWTSARWARYGSAFFSRHQLADQVHQPVDLALIDFQALWAGIAILGPASELDSIIRCNFAGVAFPRRAGVRRRFDVTRNDPVGCGRRTWRTGL
jgi:hypothetical protein